MANICGQQVAE